MTAQRILLTGLCIAIVGTVISSGDAEARNRCRRGYANGGWNNGNACNSNSNFFGSQNTSYSNQSGCANGCAVNSAMPTTMNGALDGNAPVQQVNGATQQWNPATQQWITTPANQGVMQNNQGVIQTNGTYSASKPITNDAAVQQPLTAPAPVNNNAGNLNSNSRSVDAVQQNTSPDADNEGRGASKIQGTAPSKAPLPAATGTP